MHKHYWLTLIIIFLARPYFLNFRPESLRENLAILNQYANVQNIIEDQNISLEKPSLGSLNIEQMKILWTILYPDEPFPEDDNDLRNWYENGNM